MLFVKAFKLCTTVILLTPYAKAAEDDSNQSEYSDEAGSLLKLITENDNSASLMKEIAEALEKEQADTDHEVVKKALRWGDAYEITEASSTSKSQPFPNVKANIGEHNPQSNDAYNSNDVFKNINSIYRPKEADIYKPSYIDINTPPPEKDAVQNYVDHLLSHQNVPVLLLHVSLSGLQPKQNSLLMSFPVNVNFNNDNKKEALDNHNWDKAWNLNTHNVVSRQVLPLRTSTRGESEEKDIEIAKAIKDKIRKSKPGHLLFTELDKKS